MNEYVRKLKSYTNRGGYVLINAPAVEGFALAKAPLANNINQEHINYFSAISLDNLMGKYGFIRCNSDPYFADAYEKNQLICIYRDMESRGKLKEDKASARAMLQYFDAYRSEREHQQRIITESIMLGEDIVVFGTGSFAMQLLKEYPILKEKIVFFVDNNTNKQGNVICGKEIKSADALCDLPSDTLIMICSMRNSKDIDKQIKYMGIHNKTISIID